MDAKANAWYLWDLLLLGLIGLMMVIAIGVEYAIVFAQADVLAEQWAPRFGVPIGDLRSELQNDLRMGAARRALWAAAPFGILGAVVLVRIALQFKATIAAVRNFRIPE